MSQKPRHLQQEEGTDAWLMTYADMITLLLCFFIIFVSVSEPKTKKLEEIAHSMQQGIVQRSGILSTETPLNQLYKSMQLFIEEKAAERDIAVMETEGGGLTLELASGAFFPAGSSEIRPESLPMMEEMAGMLKQSRLSDYTVEVEGHTDDVESGAPNFPSPWELSAARAAHVVRYLIDKGMDPVQFKAAGYAGTRPAVPNSDEQGYPIEENRARNRRIVLKLQRKK